MAQTACTCRTGSIRRISRHRLVVVHRAGTGNRLSRHASPGQPLEDYRHIPFNLDELALDAAARGMGVAVTDMTLAAESIERGVLVVPFGQPLKTGGIYSLCLQPSPAAHPGCAVVIGWFAERSQK